MAFFPPQLLGIEDDTAIVGDIEAFFRYLESGESDRDYRHLMGLVSKVFDQWNGELRQGQALINTISNGAEELYG